MEKKERKELLQDFERYGGLGIELVVAVLLGVFIGHWLDLRFKTDPWLTIIGFVLGTAAGFRNIYRLIKEDHE